jgi:hypothetical protein
MERFETFHTVTSGLELWHRDIKNTDVPTKERFVIGCKYNN